MPRSVKESASQSNDRRAQKRRKGCQQQFSFAKLGLCAIILLNFCAIIGFWVAGSSTNAKAPAGDELAPSDTSSRLEKKIERLQSENKFLRNRLEQASPNDAFLLQVNSPEHELPQPRKGLKVKSARNRGCRVGGIAFEGDDAASSEALKRADWHINTAGSTGPTGLGGLNVRGSVGIHFLGRGVARVKVEVLSATSTPSFTFSLNKANIVILPPGTRCTMALSYRDGDVFKIASQTDSGTGLKVESLELSAHACDVAPIRDRGCRAFERVRLPWTDCNDGAQLQRRITRWVEGRVSKIVDSSRAIVSVPLMPAPSHGVAKNAEFDPTSKLVSYVDQGTCGPRGDDAVADLAICPHGSRMIAQGLQEGYRVIASVNGCNYFQYTVYACVESSMVSQGGRVLVGTSLVMPLPSEDEVEEDDDSIAASATCPGFLDENRTIAIVLIGDGMFQRKYRTQIQTLRCYAERHGYLFKILHGMEYPECYQYVDFFFKKHCTVASWLGTQGPSLVAAIVDADVVVAVPDRGLERWANHDADVQVYERCLLPEIMAGNYMVKNSEFARSFLKQWANYFHIMPLGFSSSDNGAIHLVVQETVQAVNYEKCLAMYRSLKSSVMNLTDYFNFVKCSTDAIGPGRDWRTRGGILTVWPRFNFWAADGVFMSKYAHAERGPTMHHGIKDANDAAGHYYKNVSKCLFNTDQVLKSDGMIQHQMISMAQSYPDFFSQGTECRGTARRQCPFNCLPTFSCTPLGDHEKPLPLRSCTDCG